MIVYSGELYRHLAMMHTIGHEVLTVRNPVVLSERAGRRKPTMTLLPYGIPIAIGSIAYFAWTGLLGLMRPRSTRRCMTGATRGTSESGCNDERQIDHDTGAGGRDRPGGHGPHPADALPSEPARRGGDAGGSGRRPRLQGRGNAQARYGQGDPHGQVGGSRQCVLRVQGRGRPLGQDRHARRGRAGREETGPKGTPPGLVANIPKGMRAFAIDVTEQSGVSGFILPGHHVDVVRHEPTTRAYSVPRRSCKTCWCWPPARYSPAPKNGRSVADGDAGLKPDQVDILVVARARGSLVAGTSRRQRSRRRARPCPETSDRPEH